jgi:putative PIN family toxin of toxin-antitoxin system
VKAVVDTNILVSGLLWRGNPSRILDAILDNRVELCLTEELLAELRDVLRRPRLAKQVAERGLDAEWSCSFLRERCLIYIPAGLFEVPELRDRKDLPVLAAARAGAVDLIVTGDKDLLTLKSFAGMPIVDAAEALELLELSRPVH